MPDPPSSKIVPPDPPLLRPSRLGTTTPEACSAAKNAPAFSRNSSRLINVAKKSSCAPMCTGYSVSVFRLASSRRSNSGLSTGFTSRISPKKTILPASLPLYFSRSFSSFASTQIARPLTGPWLAADQGSACAMNTAVSGDDMRTQVFSCRQPMPNSPQSSRWALLHPMAANWSRVHSLARFRLGDPVSRGPIPSANAEPNSITCECESPSSRMRWYMVRSRVSVAGCGSSYEGLVVSSAFASLDFLSAADREKLRHSTTAKVENKYLCDGMRFLSGAEKRLADWRDVVQ